MAEYVIRIEGAVGPLVACEGSPAGQYVSRYDPDAHGGQGAVAGTRDIRRALRFASPADAIAFYRQPSKVRAYRADGRPNRPLTAFTVSFLPVDDGSEAPRGS